MSTTADDVLAARKAYKHTKRAYKAGAKPTSAAPIPAAVLAPVKAARKPRDPNRVLSVKEQGNADRLKRQNALAKEIRAADPAVKWADAVKTAAAQLKAVAAEAAQLKAAAGVDEDLVEAALA